MSGGGGSYEPASPSRRSTRGAGGAGGGASEPGGEDRCLLIDEAVRLSSPQPEVLNALNAGQTLRLQMTGNGSPILAVTEAGATAGSVVPSSLQTLVECMRSGHQYAAVVESVKGGICVVRVIHVRAP